MASAQPPNNQSPLHRLPQELSEAMLENMTLAEIAAFEKTGRVARDLLQSSPHVWDEAAARLHIPIKDHKNPKPEIVAHYGKINALALRYLPSAIEKKDDVFEQAVAIETYISAHRNDLQMTMIRSVRGSHTELVKILLRGGVTLSDDYLLMAANAANLEMVQTLLEAGARHSEALLIAVRDNLPQIFDALCQARNPFTEEVERLCFICVARDGNLDMAVALLREGARPTQESIDIAEEQGHLQLRDLLRDAISEE